jgi:hypothetical protein
MERYIQWRRADGLPFDPWRGFRTMRRLYRRFVTNPHVAEGSGTKGACTSTFVWDPSAAGHGRRKVQLRAEAR